MAKITQAKAEESAAKFAETELSKKKLELELATKIKQLNEKYKPKIDKLGETIDQEFEVLVNYAEQEKEQLFTNSKTAIVGLCKIEKRVTTSIKPIQGVEESEIIDLVTRLEPDYLKIKRSVDKAGLKKAAQQGEFDLNRLGLQLLANETTTVKVA